MKLKSTSLYETYNFYNYNQVENNAVPKSTGNEMEMTFDVVSFIRLQ